MKRFYSIAGISICVLMNDDGVMDRLREFDVFRSISDTTPDIMITLGEDSPSQAKGELFHTIKTEVADTLFYQSPVGLEMEIVRNGSVSLSLLCPKDKKEAVICGDMSPVLLRFALWTAFNVVANRFYKAVAIHSSSVVYDGKAYIFLGESGTGKSTHTELICSCYPEAELLNDDSPVIKMEDDCCRVYGSPWSGKTACYKDKRYPLGGVVRLHQGECNEITVLPLLQAIGALLPSFPPELYLCTHGQSGIYDMLSFLTQKYDVHSLKCLPDRSAACLSVNTLCKR